MAKKKDMTKIVYMTRSMQIELDGLAMMAHAGQYYECDLDTANALIESQRATPVIDEDFFNENAHETTSGASRGASESVRNEALPKSRRQRRRRSNNKPDQSGSH